MTAAREDLERLADPEDQAQRTAERFLDSARAEQARRAAVAPKGRPGICSNCGEMCLPTAVYCDEHCRDDHERRERLHARTRNLLG